MMKERPFETYIGEAFMSVLKPSSAANHALGESLIKGVEPVVTYVFTRFKGEVARKIAGRSRRVRKAFVTYKRLRETPA